MLLYAASYHISFLIDFYLKWFYIELKEFYVIVKHVMGILVQILEDNVQLSGNIIRFIWFENPVDVTSMLQGLPIKEHEQPSPFSGPHTCYLKEQIDANHIFTICI